MIIIINVDQALYAKASRVADPYMDKEDIVRETF